jgi:hypothetical protein
MGKITVGVTFGVERELLEMMPRAFVDMYSDLVVRAYTAAAMGSSDGVARRAVGAAELGKVTGRDGVRERVSSGQVSTRAGAVRAGGVVEGAIGGVVADGRAQVLKEKVDRQLRAMVRKVMRSEGEDSPQYQLIRKCSSCNRFCDETWSWCPWCRGQTQQVD